jgi:CDP-diacylglycerol--serine O-phosphatidyltransferase
MKLTWIPNLLTLGNLTCGFVSVIFASAGTPEGYIIAAALILLAALLDGVDGQVARWLGVDSQIGKELDSLADCVAFGVAPAYLAYKTYLMGSTVSFTGRAVDFGILIAAIFPLCTAYRLARFNVQPVSPGHPTPPGKRKRRSSSYSFSGLPSPVGGTVVALATLCFPDGRVPAPLFVVFFLLVGFLMISTITYTKPQSFILKSVRGFKLVGVIILVALLLFLFRFWILLFFMALYIVSGLVGYVIHYIEEHRY